jgi:hypothetical protein
MTMAAPTAVIPSQSGVKPISGGGSYLNIQPNAGGLGGGAQTPAVDAFGLGASGWAGSAGLTSGVSSHAITNASVANMALISAFNQSNVSGYAPAIGPNPLVMQSIFSHGWRENS